MKKDCLDIGIFQSFLDGELAGSEMMRVSTHIGGCDSCAIMLAEAEAESAIVFPALEREFDTLVPTQRLWNRINESISAEKQQASIWERAYTLLTSAFANPSITVAAGLLIVAGIFTTLVIDRSPVQPEPTPAGIAKVDAPSKAAAPVLVTSAPSSEDKDEPQAPSISIRPERALYKADLRRPSPEPAVYTPQPANAATADSMPGEESYVKTIANLTRTVDEQKAGGILSPSQRVAYERDMAVVDDTITKMRTALKRNPKNQSAKQILYSSYRNKIDLLNSVAQKEELVASLD